MTKLDLVDEFCNAVEEFCSLDIQESFFSERLQSRMADLTHSFLGFQSTLRFLNACANVTDAATAAAAAATAAAARGYLNDRANAAAAAAIAGAAAAAAAAARGYLNDRANAAAAAVARGYLNDPANAAAAAAAAARGYLNDPANAAAAAAAVAAVAEAVTWDAIEAKRIVNKFIFERTHQRKKKDCYPFNKIVYFFNSWKATDEEELTKKLFYMDEELTKKLFCIDISGLSGEIERRIGIEEYEWICSHERERTSSDFSNDDVLVGGEDDDDIDENMKVMLKMLMMSKENDHELKLQVVSVVGMPGIGKTTISRMIYNSGRIKSHFGFRAWVSYGVSEIIKMVRDDDINPFWKQRYLIVIDDFVTLRNWNDAKELLSSRDMLNGSRILLNTRNERLALNAFLEDGGTRPSPYMLRPLNDVQSWELFTKKVCPNPLPPDLKSIGKYIVEKCHGLPIAIEHLANHLSHKKGDCGEWLEVLHSANKQPDNDYQFTPWSYLVEIIVRNLPLSLKRCLFYLGLFPKNYTISVRRLIALWLAEGFVKPKEDVNLEYIAESYLHKLIDLNMIQVAKRRSDGRPKRCCLVHYLNEHLLLKRLKEANSNGIRRIANHHLEDGIDMSSPESYKSLVSFLSFDYREGFAPGEQINNFLYGGIRKECFQLLRVLDLERVYKPGLPKELGKLIHLRYLGLRWTYLDTLPTFIDNFINLQTLDVKHTYISNVPNSIWKLRKLRHLYLNDSFVHQPSVRNYFNNLQTLWGIFVDEESPLFQGLDRFTKITRLGVSCYLVSTSQQDAMANWILKLDNLRSLRLRSMHRLGKLSVIKLLPFRNHEYLYELNLLGQIEKIFMADEFPPNLTELTLSASKLEEDPMPILGLLSKLSILKLHSDTFTGKHMVCKSSGFMQLKVLEIWKLKNLEIWSVEEGTMQVLEKLEIRSCEHLELLPIGLQQITTLKELTLTDMPKRFTEEVKEDKDKNWYKRAGVHFVYWDSLSSNVAQSSSSPPCSCFGNLLLFLLLHWQLLVSTTKHARVKGVPALTYRRQGGL